jgi:putative membrane-bound dehydrogenase-like protein
MPRTDPLRHARFLFPPGAVADSPKAGVVILVGMDIHLLRGWIGLAAVIAGAHPAWAQKKEAVARAPRRVLVYTVSAGFEHEVVKREKPEELSLVERTLVDLGKKTGRFEAVVTRDEHDFTPEKLAKIDLVFFYTTGELPLSKDEREALLDFVKKGGAFAGAHCAADTFYKVPEYGEMIGAYFDGHPWHQEIRVKVEDRENPATKHLGEGFKVTDEIYQYKAPYDRKKLHVLLSLDTSSVDLKVDAVHRKDGDFALAWCKDYGKGRVFYTALGHRPELWKDERFLGLLDGGFRWAMRIPEDASQTGQGAPKGPEKKEEKKEDKKEGGEKPPQRALPLVPDGFAVDLIAEEPEILWPSSNTCLPDGSLLVGEDRMDMPGPTDQPLDRVIRLRWKEGGGFEKTVFAEKLFAVMGMAEVDGAVYVMNMPHLTRLRDADGDGVAEERSEILTDLGPPAPGFPGGFNDHIVSGVRLGMDGFLYISVGDKGIPGAHGTDGSTIQLRGGGVVRVRPDGSGLEIVATGLRNVLDVAIDERGEMFTYDNTDDGLGWWTRLTHIVVGGYYGYPWDYHEHQDRMLPCMAEYGGGSPTGGLVYREAAWPEYYQGNLFFCEWGKGALRRFVLEPDGATFKVKTAEDFVRAGDVQAFKPLDVCESPDGRFLYISDWGYDGWTNPKEAGRLWRIRRADDDAHVPSVAKPLPKDVDGLVAALGDASFSHRLRAQRELARRGTEVVPRLRSVLEGARGRSPANLAEERRQRHALWARSAIDTSDRPLDLDLGLHADWALSEQAVRALGPRFVENMGEYGHPGLDEFPRFVTKEMVIALGSADAEHRSKAGEFLAAQMELLATRLQGPAVGDADRFLRTLVVQSIRRLRYYPDPRAWHELLGALRGAYDPGAVEMATRSASQRLLPGLRAAAIDVLADLYRKPEPWDGKWWSIQPAKSPPPSHTIDWECSEGIRRTVREHLDDARPEPRSASLAALRDMGDRDALPLIRARWGKESHDEIRALLLDVLGALKDENATELLGSIVRGPMSHEAVRRLAIDTACTIRTASMVDLLSSVADDPAAPATHVVPCLLALARLKEPRTSAVVARRLGQGDEKIRVAAAAAIVDIDGEVSAGKLEPLLRDPSLDVRLAAIRAFGRLKLRDETPKLLPLVDDEATRAEAIQALAAAPDPRALSAYLLGLDRKNRTVQDASRMALAAVREDMRGDLEALCAQGRLDEVQLAAVQMVYQEPQPILDWRLLGPFKRGDEPKLAGQTLDFARKHPGASGADVAWIDHRAEPKDGFVDLEKLLSKSSEVSAYAAAEVRSASDREADIAIGSDDSVAVWVNGELAHEFKGNRAWSADEDRFRVKLRSGANPILLLVGNSTGGWSFNAKISGDPTGPLFARKANRPDLEEYRSYALGHRGDPVHGFESFRKSRDGAMCIRCHTVFGVGEKVGPDLSDIGAKYGRDEILASILTPSQRIAEGYRSSSLELEDGRVLFGMVQRETADEIDLYDTNGELQKIEKTDVASRRTLDTSVMPDGLWSTISREDLTDLVDWLTTLRGAPVGK